MVSWVLSVLVFDLKIDSMEHGIEEKLQLGDKLL